jgi:hypothetical protein
MDPNEPYSNVQKTSEDFRSALQSSEDFSSLQSISKRAGGVGRGKKYAGAEIPHQDIGHDFIIMEQAYAMFESEGERRSVRSIAEYCKNGELVCSYDSDDKRWHITRESVEQKIAKIKAFNARKAAAAPQNPQHISEPFTEAPAASQRPTAEVPPQSEATPPSPEADKKIAQLEQENFDLKITNKAKDMYIAQLVDDREKLLTRVETTSRLVGRLKSKLLQLVAPQATRDIDVLASPPDMTPDPSVVNGSPHEPLADKPTDHYEHSSQ